MIPNRYQKDKNLLIEKWTETKMTMSLLLDPPPGEPLKIRQDYRFLKRKRSLNYHKGQLLKKKNE